MNFTISPVNKEQVEKMRANLVAHKTSVVLDVINDDEIDYKVDGHGVGILAQFKTDHLEVTVFHKPFYVTMERLEDGIKEAMGIETTTVVDEFPQAHNAPILEVKEKK